MNGRRVIEGTWRNVQSFINLLWNGLNLRPQFLFNLVQIEPIVPIDQIDGKSQVSEPATSTDTMEIGFGVLWKIEINDDVDGLNVDSAGEQVCADEVSTDALTKIVEYAIAVGLEHFGMRVET